MIIDLKTGRPNARHRQDLGFYALIETLARDVPPRKLATFYLDASEAQSEDVSERLLRSAIRRTLDGINAIIELEYEGRTPGPATWFVVPLVPARRHLPRRPAVPRRRLRRRLTFDPSTVPVSGTHNGKNRRDSTASAIAAHVGA